MGRDWYWGGKTGTAKKEDNIRETPGCMSGVLHLFDFHQFQFPISQPPCFKPNSIPQEDPTFSKGSEAPRNSLESDHDGLTREKQQEVHFPVEEIRVSSKAAMRKENVADELSSDSCSSPGPKTPSLVARLMGLDLLPDTLSSSSSPSSSVRKQSDEVQTRKQIQSKSNQHKSRSKYLIDSEILSSRSLPDTPRVSSSSSRRSDVDARFSLQIQRDNIVELDYFSQEKSKRRDWILKDEEENKSPGHYARQIVKQVKESVSRRVGSDITNTHNNNSSSSGRFKSKEVEEVVILKSKKPKRLTKIGEESNSHKQSSNSPRLRLCEENKSTEKVEQISANPKPCPSNQPVPVSISAETNPRKAKQKPKSQPLPHHQTIEKCKKPSCERFTQRSVRGSKQEKKCKNTTGTAESSPSTSSSTSLHHHHVQTSEPISCESGLSSSTSRVCSSLNNPTNFADEIRYTSEILKCTGIHRDSLLCLPNAKWFSPSHPLDPSIFHYLEIHHYEGKLKQHCNRKLIFNLIDELLVRVLKPYLNMKPWRENVFSVKKQMRGEELLQRLSKEIIESPLSNCQTLEDIDKLIEKDLVIDSKLKNGLPVFEGSESIVFEIEQDILDSLVHETADDMISCSSKNGNNARNCVQGIITSHGHSRDRRSGVQCKKHMGESSR